MKAYHFPTGNCPSTSTFPPNPPAMPSFSHGPSKVSATRRQGTSRKGISLFWRTFFFLSLLLLGSIVAWLQTFRALESAPLALQSAQQVASLVNLTRAGLRYSDAIARVSLIKTLADQEGVQISPREPADTFVPARGDPLSTRITEELTKRMGSGTVVASAVNGVEGLWVGFSIEGDSYWLKTDAERVLPPKSSTWLIWLFTAAVLSLSGAAFIAGLINQPLKRLSFATSRMRDGDFDASLLDEKAATSEIREVNIGFNRMAEELSKLENDRAIMLAGISHDLRTPLARLRLETEMSVSDESARAHMAADISQLDAIIGKFLDYARPDIARLTVVSLQKIMQTAVYAVTEYEDMEISLHLQGELDVMADEVELLRVISNLLENARRYGKSTSNGRSRVEIAAKPRGEWVLIRIRDHGGGVPEELLNKLTRPFFRGDAARTEATGSGLGLAIVHRTIMHMGGVFKLTNSRSGGLAAHIRLRRA